MRPGSKMGKRIADAPREILISSFYMDKEVTFFVGSHLNL